jgi:hypothetical protein
MIINTYTHKNLLIYVHTTDYISAIYFYWIILTTQLVEIIKFFINNDAFDPMNTWSYRGLYLSISNAIIQWYTTKGLFPKICTYFFCMHYICNSLVALPIPLSSPKIFCYFVP